MLPVRSKIEQSPEFFQGIFAFRNGISDEDCPYPKSDSKRTGWLMGYYQERTKTRLNNVLTKYNQTFP